MTTPNNSTPKPEGAQAPPPKPGLTPASPIMEKTLADSILQKVAQYQEAGGINLPKDYSPANALKLAWLAILDVKDMSDKPALEVCTQPSIANAMLKMIIQGLNPVKRQCSFIVYGNQLQCQREYNGAIMIAKRDGGVLDIKAKAVFEGDVFEYEINPETSVSRVLKHTQTLESRASGKLKGAYAVKEYCDGTKETEIMSWPEIVASWKMGKAKGNSPAHQNFPDQMAIKTVIGRCLKIDINSSDDSEILGDEDFGDVKVTHVSHQIEQGANKMDMTMDLPPKPTPEPAQPSAPQQPVDDNAPAAGETSPPQQPQKRAPF